MRDLPEQLYRDRMRRVGAAPIIVLIHGHRENRHWATDRETEEISQLADPLRDLAEAVTLGEAKSERRGLRDRDACRHLGPAAVTWPEFDLGVLAVIERYLD